MIRRLLAVLAALFVTLAVSAQSHKLTLQLKDATSGEAVGFATVSLTPEKGQHKYTLSDAEGKAVLDKLKNGKYVLKAELMGYKTHQQSLDIKADLDLGVIKMELDQQVLDAAAVTAVGTPIIIKKDTVVHIQSPDYLL